MPASGERALRSQRQPLVCMRANITLLSAAAAVAAICRGAARADAAAAANSDGSRIGTTIDCTIDYTYGTIPGCIDHTSGAMVACTSYLPILIIGTGTCCGHCARDKKCTNYKYSGDTTNTSRKYDCW